MDPDNSRRPDSGESAGLSSHDAPTEALNRPQAAPPHGAEPPTHASPHALHSTPHETPTELVNRPNAAPPHGAEPPTHASPHALHSTPPEPATMPEIRTAELST